MSYDVRNSSSGRMHLQGTTATVHLNGDADGCRPEWFRIDSNTVPTDVDVAPGSTVHGSLVVALDAAPVSQDACKGIGVEVVVTAS